MPKKYTPKPRGAVAGTFPFLAGEHLYNNGPMLERDLFLVVGTNLRPNEQAETLQRGIRSGWLMVAQDGKVDCSPRARERYDELAGKLAVEYVGQIAAPREAFNAYDRPPLRREYMPNSRGVRQDVPTWSVRDNPSFHRG